MIVIAVAIIIIIVNKFSGKYGSEYNTPMGAPYKVAAAPNDSPVAADATILNQPMSVSDSLLPKDNNSQWAELNPSGKGELANINLLKAGYHIGIDTIGQSLRNANLQLRSEPPNPQINVGPWNQSTITPDFMRVPLEIGCGKQ